MSALFDFATVVVACALALFWVALPLFLIGHYLLLSVLPARRREKAYTRDGMRQLEAHIAGRRL